MLFDPEVLAWAVPADSTGIHGRLAALRAIGFDVRLLSSPEEVAARARQRAVGAYVPVLLMGSGPPALEAAGWLRARLPGACLVALPRTAAEDERMAWLRMGVDWICLPGDSADLVAAVLLALWRRHLGAAPGSAPRTHAGWTLRGYAWTLEGPDGARMGLTAGELAVLSVLFDAPGLSARHAELRAALEDAYGRAPDAGRPLARLGVVINRMRAKGRRAGLAIPIRAVRGHGYVFGLRPVSGNG